LTLLPDDAATYWCLLTNDGVATSGAVPVSLDNIKKVANANRIEPAGRGRLRGNRHAPVLDWRAMLAPLAAPVAAAQRAGRMLPGDRLFIAPQGSLHAFPLQELPGADCDLGERLHVSRVHSAAAVLGVLANPPKRPRRAVALWAPTAIEADSALHVASFDKVVAALRRHLPTEIIRGVAADAESLQRAATPDTLMHLCSHGTFAVAGAFNQRSQLLLSDRQALPTLDPAWHPFGPANLLTSVLDGGHVTLQACVSGYAAANPQGDAIGLEWAFLLAGAASTLGTHWHVPPEETADFSATFYDSWLAGASRAHSGWIAADRLRRHGSQQWSAFSLTGDWR
jgi:CHAT domain